VKTSAKGPVKSDDSAIMKLTVQMPHDEEELLLWEDKDAIHQEIGRGLAELDRGEGIPGDVSRARLHEKKADWLNQPRQP
jgi:hypothetical protein